MAWQFFLMLIFISMKMITIISAEQVKQMTAWKKTVENSRKIFAPYKDKIKFYKEGVIDEKIKEIKGVSAYGHTPGHSLINISDKNKELLFVSDLFHI